MKDIKRLSFGEDGESSAGAARAQAGCLPSKTSSPIMEEELGEDVHGGEATY